MAASVLPYCCHHLVIGLTAVCEGMRASASLTAPYHKPLRLATFSPRHYEHACLYGPDHSPEHELPLRLAEALQHLAVLGFLCQHGLQAQQHLLDSLHELLLVGVPGADLGEHTLRNSNRVIEQSMSSSAVRGHDHCGMHLESMIKHKQTIDTGLAATRHYGMLFTLAPRVAHPCQTTLLLLITRARDHLPRQKQTHLAWWWAEHTRQRGRWQWPCRKAV